MYEERQSRMAEELISVISAALISAKVNDSILKALTEDLAFSVAAIVDGSSHMPFDDDHLVPILAFAEGRMRERLLVPQDGGSSLHDFIPGYVELAFES
jgi:hypothetical protein